MSKAPKDLAAVVSDTEFTTILTYAIAHLKGKSFRDIHLDDGILKYKGNDNEQIEVNFINLVKNVICHEPAVREDKTKEYLDKFYKDKHLLDSLINNYSKAKEYLTIRLQAASTYQETISKEGLLTHIYTIDVPETHTVLALDLPHTFHILSRKDIAKWHDDDRTLFELAHDNNRARIDRIEVKKRNWNGATIFTLFDGDYSASYCIDFGNNCENLIGQMGSIVCFPTKGSVFVHPVSDIEQFNIAFPLLVEKVIKFYQEDPGPITRNIYWYYEDTFIKFETGRNNEDLTYTIPKQLHEMLG